jgi:hypothetical protein
MIVNQSNDGEPLSYPGVKDALVTAQPENYCPQTRSQVTAHPEHDLSADTGQLTFVPARFERFRRHG